MGSQMSDRVRLKSIELLYGWGHVLSHEPKVKEAYQMLKKQGIIKYDPVHIDKVCLFNISLCHFLQIRRDSCSYICMYVRMYVQCRCCFFKIIMRKLHICNSVCAVTDVGATATTSSKEFYF